MSKSVKNNKKTPSSKVQLQGRFKASKTRAKNSGVSTEERIAFLQQCLSTATLKDVREKLESQIASAEKSLEANGSRQKTLKNQNLQEWWSDVSDTNHKVLDRQTEKTHEHDRLGYETFGVSEWFVKEASKIEKRAIVVACKKRKILSSLQIKPVGDGEFVSQPSQKQAGEYFKFIPHEDEKSNALVVVRTRIKTKVAK